MTTSNELDALKQELSKISAKISELEQKSEKEPKNNCLIDSSKSDVQFLFYDNDENFTSDSFYYGSSSIHPMHFSDQVQCQRYADALTTFILLRKQPGSCKAIDYVMQYVIKVDEDYDLYVGDWRSSPCKISEISPCFETEEQAEQAIRQIGKERILEMFKNFHS